METLDKHLVFKVKDQLFTISVQHVNTIIQIPRVFKVPQAPDFILGVINVEGDVIPLIDSSMKLGMNKSVTDANSQVIILQRSTTTNDRPHRLAFVVDEVSDVADIDSRKIQPLPLAKFEFDERLVDGMHKINNEFCMQLNIDNFFKGDIDELIESLAAQKQ
jgi:purine-binding chemotaxis protein CheW